MADIGRRAAVAAGGLLLASALALLPLLPKLMPPAAAGPDPLDRAQLHRNANRGVPYLDLAREGADAGDAHLVVRPIKTIELDGDPLQNVYGALRPIDVDGDGTFEFAHFNGTRYLQVWSASGRKLWRVEDPDGYLHDVESGTHRDTAAILDLDGDGRQDIAHCWNQDGRHSLVYRRGLDGEVIRGTAARRPQQGVPDGRVPRGRSRAAAAPGRGCGAARGCAHDWVDYWALTEAYDLEQRLLWQRDTCDAGHYAWPVDADADGRAEAIFVGKYLLRPDGKLTCTLAGWPKGDHVDGMTITDLDPGRPGLEAVAVGRSGAAMFDAETCRAIWRIPPSIIGNPQHVAAARLDPDPPCPSWRSRNAARRGGPGPSSSAIRAGSWPPPGLGSCRSRTPTSTARAGWTSWSAASAR